MWYTIKYKRNWIIMFKDFFFVFFWEEIWEMKEKNLENIGTYKIFDSILNCYVYTRDIYEDINSDHVTLKITFFTLDEIFVRSERFKVGSIVSLSGFFIWKWCLYTSKILNIWMHLFQKFLISN